MNQIDERVLIVEDDPYLRELVGIVLRDEGYGVLEADNGKSALELLGKLQQQERPTCMVLDLMMPVMNGNDFLDALERDASSELRNIPVIVYSAEGLLRPHRQVVAKLEKPVSIEVLCGAIRGAQGMLN